MFFENVHPRLVPISTAKRNYDSSSFCFVPYLTFFYALWLYFNCHFDNIQCACLISGFVHKCWKFKFSFCACKFLFWGSSMLKFIEALKPWMFCRWSFFRSVLTPNIIIVDWMHSVAHPLNPIIPYKFLLLWLTENWKCDFYPTVKYSAWMLSTSNHYTGWIQWIYSNENDSCSSSYYNERCLSNYCTQESNNESNGLRPI